MAETLSNQAVPEETGAPPTIRPWRHSRPRTKPTAESAGNTSAHTEIAALLPIQQPPRKAFAHPSEEEFSHILNFYGVRWEYEPHNFPLRWVGKRVVESFTPDFYLRDLNMYVELTTLRQSLVTEKNRKLRRLRELYPEVNAKLLYRRDYHRILAKYGFGPLASATTPRIDRVLLSTIQIQKRVADLGRQLSLDYANREPVLVGVLRGVMCFMSDLMREISLPISVDYLAISHYGAGSQGVHITKELEVDIAGRDVLLVEDIVDTGMTLRFLLGYLQERKPSSIQVCTLLDKRIRRIIEMPIPYIGFEIPDEFVVGYGLDYIEKYRNLPFIGVLTPEAPPG